MRNICAYGVTCDVKAFYKMCEGREGPFYIFIYIFFLLFYYIKVIGKTFTTCTPQNVVSPADDEAVYGYRSSRSVFTALQGGFLLSAIRDGVNFNCPFYGKILIILWEVFDIETAHSTGLFHT